MKKKKLNINQGFISRLKHRIYNWYVDSDFILLKFMCHRGSFREDINPLASPSAGAPTLKYRDVNTEATSPGEVIGLIRNVYFVMMLKMD